MRFVEDVHKYLDEDGEYTPVTSFLKSFQEYVNWREIAEKKAKKEGTTADALLAQWDEIKTTAANKGTAFHKKMEDQMIAAGIVKVDNKDYPLTSYDTFAGIKEDSTMELSNDTVYAEKMIWSKKYKVCGTADLVHVIGNKIHVLDYKTNKKLDWESWRNPRTGQSRKLKAPISSLDDCNGNIYQMQLNTYMYMLLQANRHLKMGDMTILHIVDVIEDEVITGQKIIPYKVKNLQTQVKACLETFKR